MAVAPTLDRTYTADELFCFPHEFRYELVKGKLREMAPTGGAHGSTTSSLGSRIHVFVEDRGLGHCFAAETGFLLERDPDTVLAPDFSYVAKGRLSEPLTEKYPPVAPDLVVETRSPSETRAGAGAKAHQWLEAGVRMVLELNPRKKELTVYRPGLAPKVLSNADTFSGEDVLPGFTRPVSTLFG
jgi:Uma2 family endonuclease